MKHYSTRVLGPALLLGIIFVGCGETSPSAQRNEGPTARAKAVAIPTADLFAPGKVASIRRRLRAVGVPVRVRYARPLPENTPEHWSQGLNLDVQLPGGVTFKRGSVRFTSAVQGPVVLTVPRGGVKPGAALLRPGTTKG